MHVPIFFIVNKIAKHILFYDNIQDFEKNIELNDLYEPEIIPLLSDIVDDMNDINNIDLSNDYVDKFIQTLESNADIDNISEYLYSLYKQDKNTFANKIKEAIIKIQNYDPNYNLLLFYKHYKAVFEYIINNF